MDRVWYVAYASNLGMDRFTCYLAGGRPWGGARTYPGCRDATDPAGTFSLELSGELLFAGESGVWGGGMAFYEPHATGWVACRAYLLTAEQFADVAAQEMRHPPGGAFAREFAEALPEVGELHRLGPGRYETVVRVGERDGVSMLTVTNGDARALGLTPPSAEYVRSIAAGLREAHGWDDARIALYLVSAPGTRGAWTPQEMLDAIS